MAPSRVLLLLAVCLPAALAHCPSPPVMKDFKIDDYLGTWYEMEHNYNPGENSKQSCGKSEISKVDADKYNLVFNTTWKYRGKTTRQVVQGNYDPTEETAKIKVKPIPLFPRQNLWILDTDYENYSINWSCAEFFLNSYQLIWIYSRETTMRPEHRLKAYNKLMELGFSLEDLIVLKHEDC